jgi:hypothetical protein
MGSILDRIRGNPSLIPMKWQILSAVAVLIVSAQARISEGAALLDKVISHPGSYCQVCDVMSAPTEIPYRAFVITDFAGAGFSKANQAAVDQNRGPLIKAIRRRLLAVDFLKPPKQPKIDPKPEENMDGDAFGCDPTSLNPLLLRLIVQLHAAETLPELLALEERLVKGIAKAKDDAKAAPPLVDGWLVQEEMPQDENEEASRRDRRINLFNARVAQRDLVMVMALLLREKSYPAYLNTSLEAAYVVGLKKQAMEGDLAKLKPGEPIPKELEHLEIEIDSISKLPRARYSSVQIPYSRESRDEVRAVAVKWISEHS